MKSTGKIRLFIITALCLTLFFISCRESTTEVYSGNSVISGKIVNKFDGTPCAGVAIRLIDNSFKAFSDSLLTRFGSYSALDSANNAAIIATTTTRTDGTYTINSLSNGDYSVVPGDPSDANSVSYELDKNTTSFKVNLKGNNATVNFLRYINTDTDEEPAPYIYINVAWKNFPHSNSAIEIVPYRRRWTLFVPSFESVQMLSTSTLTEQTSFFGFDYGYTALFYTLDNAFYFRVTYSTGEWVLTPQGYEREKKTINTPLIYFPLSATPSGHLYFDYDFGKNTMTQL